MSDTARASSTPGLRQLLAVLLLTFACAAAAQAPQLRLSPSELQVGQTGVLRALGLEPDAVYVLVVEAPDGERRELELRSDADGGLELELAFRLPGAWAVRLEGGGADASLGVEIAPAGDGPAEDAPAAAPAETPAATPGAAPAESPAETPGEGPSETPSETPAETPTPAPSAPDEAPPAAVEGEPGAAPSDTPAPPTPAPGAAEEAAPAPGATLEPDRIERVGDTVIAQRDGRELWRLDFPPGSGGTSEVLEHLGRVWVAHGNSVLELTPASGRVERRYLLPARVTALDPEGEDVSAVATFDDGLSERLDIRGGRVQGVVRFGSDPALFDWLRAEAAVEDPAARLERDPTNSWLHALAGEREASGAEARRRYAEAVDRAETFYDLAALARFLQERGQPELAERAMDEALRDFAARGYAPELLTGRELRDAYAFPLGALEDALDRDDLPAAAFWAPWVHLLAAPEVPATRTALTRYARDLRAEGRTDEAATWRERARAGRRTSATTTLDRIFGALARLGTLGVAAMLLTIVLLMLTLTAKYWRPQSAMLRRRAAAKSRIGPVPRLFSIRYFSFTEKLVLVILFAATLALAALAVWGREARALPPALGSGTLASAPAREYLEAAPLRGERAGFVRGYAAQVAGEASEARRHYRASLGVPAALNNLGALEADEALYQRALDLSPGMTEARYNLGLTTAPSPFHDRYRPGEPMLAPPAPTDLQAAVAGGWDRAVARAFTDPWGAFVSSPLLPVPRWVWWGVLALFLLLALAAVLWLLVPRPRLARNAPRTPLYHLLALLVPGSGLADEAWGVLLLLPWAVFGADALVQAAGWGAPLGLELDTDLWVLGALYLVNLVAFVVEYVSYRRRMVGLRRSDPELALEFGMKPRPPREEEPA